MAATTTPSTSSLVATLEKRYPEVTFKADEVFSWQPETKTLTYNETQPDGTWQLLHELGHALLEHQSYSRDIELIGFERDAWKKAQEIASSLSLSIPTDSIEDHLDTYRDWLHQRSQCISCSQTGIQTANHEYTCPHCKTRWRVNDARTCELRRYEIKK